MLIPAATSLVFLASLTTAGAADDVVVFIPAGVEEFAEDFRLAPAIRAGDFVFTSGVAAFMAADSERTPEAFEAAIREAFDQIGATLDAAGADWSDVVEMTSFHVDMREHQEIFRRVRAEFITEAPYPAWTAIGVEHLWIDELFVEIRVQAYLGGN